MPCSSSLSPRPAPTSAAPSLFYRQHRDVEAPVIDDREFRQACRVKTRLGRLLREGRISALEWRRADQFRRLFETAHKGALATLAFDRVYVDKYCRRRGNNEPGDTRVAALKRLMLIREGLGETAYKILLMAVIEDRTLCDVAKQLGGIDPKTLRAWAAASLAALAAI